MSLIPAAWMPRVPMKRIHGHWTAGNHRASPTDIGAYHTLIEGDGTPVKGKPSIAANSGGTKDGYAAHTLNANSDAIGISMCGMAGAVESPFNPGRAPLTKVQWDAFIVAVAEHAKFYEIPVTPKTILFHAEVEANLGIKQRNKWDVTRLPFDPSVVGAKAIGDKMRREVAAILAGGQTKPAPEPIPADGIAEAIVKAATSSLVKGGSVGSIPAGTRLSVLSVSGDRVQVKTPAGYKVWVDRTAIRMIDGPPALEPTTPSPRRKLIAEIRERLDALEALEDSAT